MRSLIEVKKRPGKSNDLKLAKSLKTVKQVPPTIKGGISARINEIRAMVEKNLGKYKDDYLIISDADVLNSYIDKCIEQRVISIDTETTGLDPLLNDVVGICIYTPGEKAAYVPLNHKSYITQQKSKGQLDIEAVREVFDRLVEAHPDIIMFNANFDIRIMRNCVGVKDIYCTWDAYIAGKLMNENEESGGLKALHKKYVLDGKGDAFSFDALFKGITFDYIPINVGYLYAAHDAIITYELYEYQKQYLYYDRTSFPQARNGMNGVAWVFFNIEMPCINVVTEMEDTGIAFDLDYADKLSKIYNKRLDDCLQTFYDKLALYDKEIQIYKRKNAGNKLSDPISIGSPQQIAILLYDIMKMPVVDDKKPRGTGEDILLQMDDDSGIVKAILEYREVAKLVSTYIDKLPECVNPKDGRIHCSFNQYGAKTGRFSSDNPNLQNIPSHNKDIRKMFVASPGYVLMSSDYSQQEPKVMTQMCGDSKMIDAYKHGKDLYAEIAALSFNTAYENCLEFRPDGTTNPEGKNRRSQAKSILLGVLYGRGVPSIAEQLGTSTKKAQAIKDSVFKGFPAIPQFEQDSLQMAEELGYVTTLWGRKRRLPDMQLPEYEFKWKDGAPPNNDLLDFDAMNEPEYEDSEVPEDVQEYYLKKLHKCWGKQKRAIFEEANKEGIWIVDNGAKIADAERQCVNARIQGSAADMSKLAMIKVGNDKRLKELGFRLLIPVHDELIAECPEENMEECAQRFAELMSKAAEDRLHIPIKCDVEITREWYGERVDGKEKKVAERNTAREFENELTRPQS